MNIMIADDEYIIRTGIKSAILKIDESFNVVAEASDGLNALELADTTRPDIIIADINMPKCSGLEFINKLREFKNYAPEIIILTGFREFDYIQQALELGVSAFLLKPVKRDVLAQTLFKCRDEVLKKRKISSIVSDFNSEFPVLKNTFLLKLLTGTTMTDSEINQQFLTFNIARKKFFIVIFIKSDQFNHKLINDNLDYSDMFFSYYCNVNSSESSILTFSDSCDNTQIYENLQKLSNKLSETTSAIPKIGISKFYSRSDYFSTAYYEALEACAFAGDNSNIKFYDAVLYNQSKKKEIQEALNIIARDFGQPLTIDKVSGELKISSSTLMHSFKQETGRTFNSYLTEYRMKMAADMLKSKEYKIYEIADRLGYKSTKHFSKLFKKITGHSPSDYLNEDEKKLDDI